MKGLTEIEWHMLEVSCLPDPCDEDTECGDETPEEAAAHENLVARGLVRWVPCVYDPEYEHVEPTSLGRTVLGMGREAVVT